MNLFSKFRFGFAALAVAAMLTTTMSSAVEAQSKGKSNGKGARERAIGFFADGTLSLSELTRAQQAEFAPVVLARVVAERERVGQELDAITEAGQELIDAGASKEDLEPLREAGKLVARELVTTVNLAHFLAGEVLYGGARSPKKALSNRQLVALGQSVKVTAIEQQFDLEDFETDVSAVLVAVPPQQAANIYLLTSSKFDIGRLVGAAGKETVSNVLFTLKIDQRRVLRGSNKRNLVNHAQRFVTRFLRREFGQTP